MRRLGFEAVHLTYRQHQRLTQVVADAGLEVAWQPLEGLVEGLRQIKTGAELAVMRRALILTETVMRQVAGELAPGQTERQVAWEIEKRLREGGAEDMAFPPIVAAGPNSARPHHHPGDYALKNGEPIIIDMGAKIDGYCADMTRTFIMGPADEPLPEDLLPGAPGPGPGRGRTQGRHGQPGGGCLGPGGDRRRGLW